MPYKDPEKQKAYQAARYASAEYKRVERERWASPINTRRKDPKPFVGVDGEGGLINGRHEYALLRVGENLLYHDSAPLRSVDILRWLCSLPNDGINVGFGFDYDVTMILRDWPMRKLAELFDKDSRKYETEKGQTAYYPVGYAGFLVEYLPRKHFRVKRWEEDPVKREAAKYFTVHDVIGFYQSSFVQALESWSIGTPEEREKIRAMKNKRAEFTEATEEEIEYNYREVILLKELVEQLRGASKSAGYTITTYEGAGCLAQAMLTKHKAPQRQELPDALGMAARSAYYGGRFEISRIGRVAPVHEYDLASAYPWAMAGLPCLQHGEWVNEWQPGNPIQVMRMRWGTSPERRWGPYPFRDPDGAILYPSAGEGWYWYPEVAVEDEAREYNEILDAWSFIQGCDHKPFDWIPGVYAERQRIGKSAKGKVLKLALNSLYGKQAQSVGNPRFASPIYAGLITSKVRALMAQVCLKHGDAVTMIATDGIYLTHKMQPRRGQQLVEAGEPAPLGCWEHTQFDNMFQVKPGIYFTDDGVKVKTRGISRWHMEHYADRIRQAWYDYGLEGQVTIDREPGEDANGNVCDGELIRKFIGARMAVAQNAPEKLGQWLPASITMSFASNLSKRLFQDDGTSEVWSRDGKISTPYRKTFGMELANELLYEDLDMTDVIE